MVWWIWRHFISPLFTWGRKPFHLFDSRHSLTHFFHDWQIGIKQANHKRFTVWTGVVKEVIKTLFNRFHSFTSGTENAGRFFCLLSFFDALPCNRRKINRGSEFANDKWIVLRNGNNEANGHARWGWITNKSSQSRKFAGEKKLRRSGNEEKNLKSTGCCKSA